MTKSWNLELKTPIPYKPQSQHLPDKQSVLEHPDYPLQKQPKVPLIPYSLFTIYDKYTINIG